MATKTINISLDEKLLKEIDKAAKAEYASRSDYIRASLVTRLNTNGKVELVALTQKLVKRHKAALDNLSQR